MNSTQYHEILPRILSGIPPSTSLWISVTLVFVTGFVIFLRFLQPKHHSQEPAVIPQRIPYVEHLVGIIKHGLSYYQVVQ